MNILQNPPGTADLQRIATYLGGAMKLVHPKKTGEAAYREQIEGRDLSDDELIAVLACHPDLLLKPIAYDGKAAVIGFDPDRLQEVVLGA